MTPLEELRQRAVWGSLTTAPSLKAALAKLAFVQADPIRAPARAQDLILRQRVPHYCAGDLETHYPSLALEEDVLYAYGFLTRPVWQCLAPRHQARLGKLEKQVLAQVRRDGEAHPSALTDLGTARVRNAWGGYSKATKRALEGLHERGLLRISRRENGIRIYAETTERTVDLDDHARLTQLAMVLANIFAPAPEKTLQSMLSRLGRSLPHARSRLILGELVQSSVLQHRVVDGVGYLWPSAHAMLEQARAVRLLAPFDPVVWDRGRFEHLWGWAYRFEAYTPINKRVRGYYALPMLWGTDVVGWANLAFSDGKLDVDLGFVGKRPRDRAFSLELEAELERMRMVLHSE